MREYRGLTKDGKDFVHGWYVKIEGAHYIIDSTVSHTWLEEDCYEVQGLIIAKASAVVVIPKTVGQSFIVEGKEFYEGDVTKDDNGDLGVVRFGKLPLGKSGDCVCTYPAFYLHCLGQLGQAPTYECQEVGEWMEIIGTIHTTHPELLSERK